MLFMYCSLRALFSFHKYMPLSVRQLKLLSSMLWGNAFVSPCYESIYNLHPPVTGQTIEGRGACRSMLLHKTVIGVFHWDFLVYTCAINFLSHINIFNVIRILDEKMREKWNNGNENFINYLSGKLIII